ncbi:MAG: heavy-metal-associated domain-containing protein [Propionibacteriaceae bacterium]|jgi:copper chaperone CopZ|nr:heavy-metal-associated domain-containing protein [Propionibacteriaceae bacterium]
METKYTVSGMTCQHCVAHVTEEVSAVAGVDQVSVSLDDGSMAVTSAAPIAFDAIKAAVDEAGDYTVAPA